MASSNDVYLAPYLSSDSELSDTESDSEASYDSWGDQLERPPNAEPLPPNEIASPDFATFAKGLQSIKLQETAGPSFVTTQQELAYSVNEYDRGKTYGNVDFKDISGAAQKPQKVPVQTVVMMQSRDRYRKIFPQPTNCHLFLPRIYREITSFSLAQINLTSAFFYFRADKENLYITINEKDRILYNSSNSQPVLSNGQQVPLNIKTTIRPGSYNISQLLAEIQQQLNKTPLFYDFVNGFSDFYPQFVINGDYSLNFNYPGDNYYDAVQRVYIQNPTRAQITSYYFQSQFANLSFYTTDQVRIAYYYPVLKEALLDPQTLSTTYNLTYPGLTPTEVRTYLIYNFTGLSDPVALQIINQNQTLLDEYRILHTFRYSLVNEYVCTFDQTNNRVTIKSSRLNTSLFNLLNTQYNAYFAQQLALYNITQAQYNALFTQNNTIVSILQSMYDYLQIALARGFAVNFGTFSRDYYADPDNTILIRNGLDASGVAVSYTPSVTTRNSNLFLDFTHPPPYYWQNMSNLGDVQGPLTNMGAVGQTYPTGCNFPYQIYGSNIDLTRNFIDLSGSIYTDARRKAGDILVSVEAGKYTIFKFRSAVRQTLQVESLPRQTIFRYPAYNQANPVEYPINTLFDISYSFVVPYAQSNIKYNYTYGPIYNWSNLYNTDSNFGTSFNTNLAYWGSNFETLNITTTAGRYYTFQTPLPTGGVNTNYYRYTLNVTIQSATATIPSDLYAFFYHDLAALNADISGTRLENPIHYKERLLVPSGSLGNTYQFTAYANQTYYMIVRPVSTTPAPTSYRIVPWFPNGSAFTQLQMTTNFDPAADPTQPAQLSNASFAINNDPDYIRLPITSNLWSNTSPSNDAINTIVLAGAPKIGYDISGVSNDLTDYVPFATSPFSNIDSNALIRADPTNNYIFQFKSPYNSTSNIQSYFYTGGSNILYTSNTAAQYTWQSNTLPARQYKMVQWYGTTYIDSQTVKSYSSNDISPYISPYTAATTSNTAIAGYTYAGPSNTLQLGNGLVGFSFLPADGTWAVDQITFKSNLLSNDPNDTIQALGIFITTEVMAAGLGNINAANAVAMLIKTNTTRYTPGNLNLGFDASLGSYYTFSNVSSLVTRSNAVFTGTSQLGSQFIPDSNSYYSILAFSGLNQTLIATQNWSALQTNLSNALLTPIENMVGSPIPNPYANTAFPSTIFYDGQSAVTGQQIVRSTSNTSQDPSIVQYEQSVPYVNSHMHYINTTPIISDANGFSAWSNLPLTPSYVCASVPKFMLMQNGNFVISPYTMFNSIVPGQDPLRSFQSPPVTLTIDQVYPPGEVTSLLAVAGTATSYCFLGLSNDILRFKLYTPATGILTELPTNSNYTLTSSNHVVQSFVINNSNSWYLTSLNTNTNQVDFQGDTSFTTTNTMISYTYAGNTQSQLQLDPSGATLYMALQTTAGAGFSNLTAWSLDSNSPVYVRNNASGAIIYLQVSTGSLPATYSQLSVSKVRGNDQLLFLSASDPLRYFRMASIVQNGSPASSNTTIARSTQVLPNPPTKLYGGGRGSSWMTFNDTPYIMGNRNDAYDANEDLRFAYQVFFPTTKIVMRKLTNSATPVTDLTNVQYPEWPHMMMFAYSNLNSLYADISGSGGRWGLESNYMVTDVSFNGFYFGAYTMNIPLYPNMNSNPSDSNAYYYLAVRGYLPTENYQTMLRFYLPKRYDFGYLKLRDISNEVLTIQTLGSNFSPNYSNALLAFNSNFIYTNKNFGSNTLQQIAGSNYSSSNFGQFLATYKTLQNQYASNAAILTGIQTAVTSNINQFIDSNLQYILPASAQGRQRYTDPLLFSILWKSALSPRFATFEDEWGLGWNLGYDKEDTPYSTVHIGTTFFKIQQDFIYLRLNPEFNINRVDAGGKENYAETREPTGITNQYYCKLLLTNFGGNSTTFIHNPVTFNPPLARLSKMQFQWLYPDGTLIDNIDAEWNMTINITEKIVSNAVPEFPPFSPADPTTGLPAALPKGFQQPKAQEQVNIQAIADAIELEREKAAFIKAKEQGIKDNTQQALQNSQEMGKAKQGTQGTQGAQGARGTQGTQGAQGAK